MNLDRCHLCVGDTCENQVVETCLPVNAFGNVSGKAVQVATIGLNPALNEFYESDYQKFKYKSLRLAMLEDYKVTKRVDLDAKNISDAKKRRREEYFIGVEREWHSYFEKFESMFSRVKSQWSYATGRVVHIDLAACATRVRWSKLPPNIKRKILNNCRGHFLATLSQLPNCTSLFLDGASVIEEAQNIALKREGLAFERDGQRQRINVSGNIGSKGIIKWRDKRIPV